MFRRVSLTASLFAAAAAGVPTDAHAGGRLFISVGSGSWNCGPSFYRPSYVRPAPCAPSWCAPSWCAPRWSQTICRPVVVAPVYCPPSPRFVSHPVRTQIVTTAYDASCDDDAPSISYVSHDASRRRSGYERETYEREVIETRTPSRYRAPDPCPPPRAACPEPYEKLLDRAWDSVADEYYHGALDRFAQAFRQRTCDAEPRIGYAVAAALKCDDRAAVWSMRKAFEIDPRGAAIPSTAVVERRVEHVARRYEDLVDRRERRGRRPDIDDLFMVAATRYLTGDIHAARCAIDRAIDLCDRSESARNLRDLICRDDRAPIESTH